MQYPCVFRLLTRLYRVQSSALVRHTYRVTWHIETRPAEFCADIDGKTVQHETSRGVLERLTRLQVEFEPRHQHRVSHHLRLGEPSVRQFQARLSQLCER